MIPKNGASIPRSITVVPPASSSPQGPFDFQVQQSDEIVSPGSSTSSEDGDNDHPKEPVRTHTRVYSLRPKSFSSLLSCHWSNHLQQHVHYSCIIQFFELLSSLPVMSQLLFLLSRLRASTISLSTLCHVVSILDFRDSLYLGPDEVAQTFQISTNRLLNFFQIGLNGFKLIPDWNFNLFYVASYVALFRRQNI